MKLLVLGWYDHHNIGDESYKLTFKNLFPQHSLTFVNSLKKEDVDECEAIILGGGNVIRKGFIEQLQKYPHKKIFALSAGIEEDPTQDLSFFKHIYARDKNTAIVLGKKIPCSFIPDTALTLIGNEELGRKWIKEKFQSEKHDLYENVIVVVVNSYMLNGGLENLARDAFTFIKFSYDFARTIDETPASFIFVPFGTGLPSDDRVSNAWVASKCKYWKKNYVVHERLDVETILNIMAASNMAISSRLHSSIFSFACGLPFIDITHHSKNSLFLEMIGQKDNSISFWNLDNTLLKTKIYETMQLPKHTEHEKYKEMIREKANAIRFN